MAAVEASSSLISHDPAPCPAQADDAVNAMARAASGHGRTTRSGMDSLGRGFRLVKPASRYLYHIAHGGLGTCRVRTLTDAFWPRSMPPHEWGRHVAHAGGKRSELSW